MPGFIDAHRRKESVLAGAGGSVVAGALWWIYFELVDSEAVVRTLVGGLTYTYSHFPLVAGIAALGVGVKLVALLLAAQAAVELAGDTRHAAAEVPS